MKTYRTGFLLAVIANIVLASVLAGVWWQSQTSRPTTSSALEGMPTSNTRDSTQSSMARAAALPEMPVPAVEISAQRWQSIGVKTGAVERKTVADASDGHGSLRTFVCDKGNGVYEGSGELGSGGTWQVTVVASKHGQNIASKQLSIKTAGGM